MNISSPIILDLDGGGVTTLSAAASISRYDMDGDGIGDDTSWMGRGEGMLFLDRDGNGTLTDAGEFSFVGDVANAGSDLVGLRAFDSNDDGHLASGDARFADFRIWRDGDGDGIVDGGEILTLGQAGVRSLDLVGVAVDGSVALGNVAVVNQGSYTQTDGTSRSFIDAALTYYSGSASEESGVESGRWYDRRVGQDWFDFASGYRRGLESSAMVGGPLLGQLRRALFTLDAGEGWTRFPYQWAKFDVHDCLADASGSAGAPLSASPGAVSPPDRRLAAMVQDIAAFGAQSGADIHGGVAREFVRPMDFYA